MNSKRENYHKLRKLLNFKLKITFLLAAERKEKENENIPAKNLVCALLTINKLFFPQKAAKENFNKIQFSLSSFFLFFGSANKQFAYG